MKNWFNRAVYWFNERHILRNRLDVRNNIIAVLKVDADKHARTIVDAAAKMHDLIEENKELKRKLKEKSAECTKLKMKNVFLSKGIK